ncbi:MAG TPA: ABC transporter ATP-binding protein [Pirellulales bacterium]|nr:ABC transporter ATP-binding protein [Pirellulales bacterium]
MQDAVAQFVQVTKRYSGGLLRRAVVAVDELTLRVPAGEITGIVGPNRAGKSTLVKLLLTLCRPTSGRITRLGRPWHDRSTLARIGYIHECQALPRYLSARGLLDYYGALSGLPTRTVRQRAATLLEQVGLADRVDEPIARYSKGMLQRLALAQAQLNEPELLVFDEPTEGMDLLARRMVFEALAKQRWLGRSALLVSHALGDVENICDRVAVVRHGRLVFFGLTAELSARGGNSFERALEPLYHCQEELACV